MTPQLAIRIPPAERGFAGRHARFGTHPPPYWKPSCGAIAARVRHPHSHPESHLK